MYKLKSHFLFSREHRSGILVLIAILLLFQLGWYWIDSSFFTTTKLTSKEEIQWLAMQQKIDSIKDTKITIDYNKQSFNPNFISDAKGYKLGMSIAELDRLHLFRKQNKWINSAQEFQQVTQISDSLLQVISPMFQFPEWVNKRQNTATISNKYKENTPKKIIQKDINVATKEDLIAIYMVGEKTADKILAERDTFGAFVSMKQLQFIYGISDEALQNLQLHFKIENTTKASKIDINNLSINELKKFPYFNYYNAKSIVSYRSMNGDIKSIEELTKINNFPVEKIEIIALYLKF